MAMADVQISSWMATVKANMTTVLTNVSAPTVLSVVSISNDAANNALRQKPVIQDGCGSCTLIAGASFLVLGISIALFLHKDNRGPVLATIPGKKNTLVRRKDYPDPHCLAD
jgi:hypothetical protein